MTTRRAGDASPESPFVLAVDVGSSSLRARLYDARARGHPEVGAATPYVSAVQPGGGAEEDPVKLAEEVERTIDLALERAGGLAGEIAAVGMDTFVGNVVGVDDRGRPTTPLYTYADTRSGPDAARMRQELDAAAVHQRTGVTLHTAYTSTRLAWLRRTQPDAFARTARWVDFGGFLYERWFGAPSPCSYSVASWSGLLDRHTLEWDSPLLEHIGVRREALPALSGYDDARRGLSPGWARRWPALRDVPFFLAVGDGAAASVGEGCATPGRTAITVGTTGAIRAAAGALPTVPRGLSVFGLTRDLFFLGGAVTDAGSLLAWLRETLNVPPPAELEARVAALPPDGHGLTVLPFLRGERSPGWIDSAAGAIAGLRAGTTAAEIARAAMEAVAYRLALIRQRLVSAAPSRGEIVLGGGAALASPAWAQVFADVLEQPLVCTAEPEATSRGVALLALKAIGTVDALDAVPADRGARYTPNREAAAVYRAGLERHHRLYHAVLGDEGECAHDAG